MSPLFCPPLFCLPAPTTRDECAKSGSLTLRLRKIEMLRTEETGVNIYFARPYAAWQRGTNENTNGLVRQYFPKRHDLAAESHHAVAAVEKLLDDRPRKRLAYRTPREVITQQLAHYGVAFGS